MCAYIESFCLYIRNANGHIIHWLFHSFSIFGCNDQWPKGERSKHSFFSYWRTKKRRRRMTCLRTLHNNIVQCFVCVCMNWMNMFPFFPLKEETEFEIEFRFEFSEAGLVTICQINKLHAIWLLFSLIHLTCSRLTYSLDCPIWMRILMW